MSEYSPMQMVKRRLFAMRNGVIADSLRKAGCPRRIVFGVNLPQLADIAAEFGPSRELADALWNDTACRESILLAPMMYPAQELSIEKAREVCDAMLWPEDADILCFKLLRKASFAPELAAELCRSQLPISRYAGLRLWFNIVAQHPQEALEAAEAELSRQNPISNLASMLAEEARFLLDS